MPSLMWVATTRPQAEPAPSTPPIVLTAESLLPPLKQVLPGCPEGGPLRGQLSKLVSLSFALSWLLALLPWLLA